MEETEQQQQNSGNATKINACIALNNCSLNTYKNILSLRTSGEKQRTHWTSICLHAIKWNKLKE